MRGRPLSAQQNKSVIPIALVLTAICFNAVLAFINGHVAALSAQHVILVEAALVVAAQVYALIHFNRRMIPWYAFIVLVALFSIIRMLAVDQVELKYFRDLLLIQTFVVLGMASSSRMAIRTMMLACGIVVAFIALEALNTSAFSKLFDVQDYYRATRDMVSADFTNPDSDLYVSATRPEGRNIPFFGLHRLSSIFLEPVSLGNFVILTVCFALGFWSQLTSRQRYFVIFAVIATIIASDGRQALIASALILAMAFATRLTLPNVAVFMLPFAVLGGLLVVDVGGLASGEDNLPGRLAYTVELIYQMEPIDYFGLSDRLVIKAFDSGIVYLIVTHSVFVVAALWVLIVTSLEPHSREQADYLNGICLYLALAMLVTYSFVSIKTAAPFWFLYGVLAGPETHISRTRFAVRNGLSPSHETA